MNRATIRRTVFQNFPAGEKTYGFRIYDDYGQEYCNMLEKETMELPDKDFFEIVKSNAGDNSIIDIAIENGGIFIDDDWYRFDDNGKLV